MESDRTRRRGSADLGRRSDWLEMLDHGVDVLGVNPGDMYNDDGAGRTFLGPDGAHHKFDLSPGRENDIKRIHDRAAQMRRAFDAELSDCAPRKQARG